MKSIKKKTSLMKMKWLRLEIKMKLWKKKSAMQCPVYTLDIATNLQLGSSVRGFKRLISS